jgi:chromosome partitioning protein
MGSTIAIANQKGGVGKTTSTVSLGAQFATFGVRTLVVDFDPQGSATSGLGCALHPEGEDLYDVFFGRRSLADVVVTTAVPQLDLVPASRDLVGLEIEIGKKPGRELILKSELSLLRTRYDLVLIDCPPSSGLLTLNALGAADSILIPLQAEYYSLEGLSQLMNTVGFVQQTFNPALVLLGLFVTMFDGRTNLAAQVEGEARAHFAQKMFDTRIPRSVKLSECPSHGVPICLYDPNSPGARAYKALSLEVAGRLGLVVGGSGGVDRAA